MAIYRGTGGSGDATNDATITEVTQQAVNASESADAAAASATSAASSSASALTSKTAAQTSETNAATSETNASNSASAASTSATSASNSATAASTSESNASASETNAAASASSASTSATAASGSATTASTKASEAATSASSALTYKNAAEAAKTAAETAETNAETAETNAASSATAAAGSATSASGSATTATTKASEASTSASNAATSETNAATSETNAATSETNAASSATSASTSATSASTSASTATTKASEAATSASTATTKASEASTSASNAATSATNAATSATNAAASFDSFDDRYLGSKSSEPTVDNDGDALLTGALYFNSTTNTMKVYSGSSWLDAYATLSGALLATNNLSDLNNAATARTNLGLGTAATTASTDYATSAQGTTADNALPKAGGTMTGDLDFNDNVKAKFGTGDDLQIYHDGSNSVIGDLGTGELSLQTNGTGVRIWDNANSQSMAVFNIGGASKLAHNGSWKLATTSTGVDVTGEITADGIALGDSQKATFGASDDLQIYHDGTNSWIRDTGSGSLIIRGQDFVRISGETSGYTLADFVGSTGESKLFHQSNLKLKTTSTGVDVTGTVNADGAIYLDGGTGYGQVEVGGDSGGYIDIKKPNSDDYDARLIYSGSNFDIHTNADEPIRLRHNNSTKLATTSTGVDVTGLLESNTLSTDYKKIYGISSGQGDNYYYLGSLRVGTQTDGYADILIHRSVDHGQSETTKTVVNLSQRNGTLSTGCQVYGNLSNGNNVSVKVYQDGNDLDVYLFCDDYAQSVLDITHKGGGSWQTSQGSSVTPTGTEVYDSNDEVQFIINESGNVGIGTSSPSAPLDVDGSGTGIDLANFGGSTQTNYSKVNFNTDTLSGQAYIIAYGSGNAESKNVAIKNTNSDGDVFFTAGAAERMRIDSSGRVGIGTSSPDANSQLHIKKTGANAKITLETDESNDCYINFSGATSEASIGYEPTSNALIFANAADGLTTNERMRIDSAGNVGIGTSSPTQKLEVANGYGIFEGIKVGQNGTDIDSTFLGANSLLAFKLNGSEKMRIDSSGNVLFGTTSTDTVSNTGVVCKADGQLFVGAYQKQVATLTRQSNDGEILRFRKDGSTVGSIGTSAGDLYITSRNSTGLKLYAPSAGGVSSIIHPSNTSGSPLDNVMDLGYSSGRFKDAYFSGTVNANAFVGDGSGLTGISGGGGDDGPAFQAHTHATGTGPPQTLANNTWTKCNFGHEVVDTDNCFASSRFTPDVAGWYIINCSVLTSTTSTTWSNRIRKNSGTSISEAVHVSTVGNTAALQNSAIVYLNGSTDYVEVDNKQQSGSSVYGPQITFVTYFNGALVRKQ